MDTGDHAQGHERLAQQPAPHRVPIEHLGTPADPGGELQHPLIPEVDLHRVHTGTVLEAKTVFTAEREKG